MDVTRVLSRQLAAAQEITHIGSWEWLLGGETVSWSDELYRIYGLEPGSRTITFAVFMASLHPEDRPRIEDNVRRALERGGRFQWLERIVRPDGSIRDLDTVGEAIVDDGGRVVGLIGTCRDVTDERRRDQVIQLYASVFANVQIGMCVFRVDDADALGGARLLAANPAAQQALGVPAAATLGELFPSDGEVVDLIADVASSGSVRELHACRFGGRTFAVKGFPLPGACVGLALEDISAQTRARRMRAAERDVLEMVAARATLAEALTALVLAIEEMAPPTIASILLLDADGVHIRHGAAPNLPEAYNRAVDGTEIGANVGSCGTAMFLRRSVFVADLATDPLWASYRELAAENGLAACWSTPIFASDGRVLGSFALYYREPRSAMPEELEIIGRATHVAGIAIERRQLDDQLRALSAHIEAAREAERSGIAREIHDVLGQALTVLKLDLGWVARRAAAATPIAGDVLLAKMTELGKLTDDIIGQVQRISAELRPGELDDIGLAAALEWQAVQFQGRTGVDCVVRERLGGEKLEHHLATAAFRIVQEALTNVTRHADAKHVEIAIERAGDAIHLEVRDDGVGITPEQAASPKSLGLLGIRERARALGGSATIGPAAPRGTLVAVDLPLRPA